MIVPAPTSRLDPSLARGVLGAVLPATQAGNTLKPPHIVLEVPNTSYKLHLVPEGEITQPVGKRIVGVIRARARRIDTVETGGRFIEPVFGRPRRVQGSVVRAEGGAVVVDAGVPIHCTPTDPRQTADQFKPGTIVSFDVLDGATFAQQP